MTTTRAFLLTFAALTILASIPAFAGDISGDYGHPTVGADNNDDAGDVRDADHDGEDDGAEANAAARRTAEDGRHPVNKSTNEHQGDYGND